MKTVFVKDLSGSVIPIELSPCDNLRAAVEMRLGVRPGYRAKLFNGEEELDDDTEVFDGEEFSVLVEPYDFTASIILLDRVRTRHTHIYVDKFMIEVDEGIRMFFYRECSSSGRSFLADQDVFEDDRGRIEYDERNIVHSFEDLLLKMLPDWEQEIRDNLCSKVYLSFS